MKGDYLTLSTGKKVNAINSLIGISPDGDIDDGYGNIKNLTSQEKIEVANYAKEHWTNWKQELGLK